MNKKHSHTVTISSHIHVVLDPLPPPHTAKYK